MHTAYGGEKETMQDIILSKGSPVTEMADADTGELHDNVWGVAKAIA